MTPQALRKALALAVQNNLPVIVKGRPGIGKSDIVAQVAADLSYELKISHPQVSDPTDFKGFPFPDKSGERATFLPFGDLADLIEAKHPTIAFLDDIGQAPPAVQAALMQLLLARRVNGHMISDHVRFVAATNRREDLAGVSGLLEPVKSRFAAIWELEVSLDEWCLWAVEHDLPAELIGFIRFRPNLLDDFKPSRDLVNSPSPRTVANVGKWLKAGGDSLPEGIFFETVKGAAGEAFAAEFMAFMKIYRKLPNIDLVLMNPDQAEVPDDAQTLYAICAALANRAKDTNFDRIVKYLDRIPQETRFGVELPVFAVKDAINRDKSLTRTKAFTEWCVKYGNEAL